MATPNRLLRWPQVQEKTGICRSYAHLLISQKKFPAPIKLGARASGWLEGEIDQWIEEKVSDSRGESHQAA